MAVGLNPEFLLRGFILILFVVALAFSYVVLNALLSRKRLFQKKTLALGSLLFVLVLITLRLPTEADKLMNKLSPQRAPFSTPSAEAVALHEKMFIADMHADTLMWPHRDILERHTYGHVDVPRLREGNVGLQAFTIVTGSPPGMSFESNAAPSLLADSITLKALFDGWPLDTILSRAARTLFQARALHAFADRSGGELVVVKTKQNLRDLLARRSAARGTGAAGRLVGGLLGIEGLHALDDKFENVKTFFDAGIRMMAPTHFFDNALGGSAAGERKIGLTDFGRKVIHEMERLGIVLDVAHASEATIDDVLKIATRPVVVSHTGVHAVCPGPRNLKDHHLTGIAKTGGVIAITYFRPAICGAPDPKTPGDDLKSIIDSIMHVRTLVGIEHVAIGSDFDGTVNTPFDTAGLVHITDALLQRGLTPDEVSLVMGGNVARVFESVLPDETPAA